MRPAGSIINRAPPLRSVVGEDVLVLPAAQVQVRPVMYLAVTYDHRVVDGKESVQFLVAIKQRVENPDRLMFEL